MKKIERILLGAMIAASAAVATGVTGAATSTTSTSAPAAPKSVPAVATTQPPKQTFSDYDVLMRKSIFSKDRSARRPRAERTTSSDSVPVVRERPVPVFVGVVNEDAGPVAFVEEPDTGSLLMMHVGDKLPRDGGTVRAVTLDYLEVQPTSGGATHKLVVGQTVLGQTPPPPSEVRSAAVSTSTGPASTEAATGSGSTGTPSSGTLVRQPGETMAEFMKRRRAQADTNKADTNKTDSSKTEQ